MKSLFEIKDHMTDVEFCAAELARKIAHIYAASMYEESDLFDTMASIHGFYDDNARLVYRTLDKALRYFGFMWYPEIGYFDEYNRYLFTFGLYTMEDVLIYEDKIEIKDYQPYGGDYEDFPLDEHYEPTEDDIKEIKHLVALGKAWKAADWETYEKLMEEDTK